ncbi:MAG TPA: nucleotidyl transferase AbiEii/AbiGii toxin family protein [Micromonosporaceae bacterium]|nr:nucleotidyl transferase AbiEii/AbiGii toxin family protein [Micromonosporaceae bacterium]
MSRVEVAFHREVAQVALEVANKYGFALGGGLAWISHGLVRRPTEDVDLFSDTDGAAGAAADEVRAALLHAGFAVRDEEPGEDLADLFYGFDREMREFQVLRDGCSVVLSLGRLNRLRSPVVMDIGPVLHVDDLVASKVAALVNRREVRDYVDAAAALDHYSLDRLIELAHRHDPGLEPDDVVEVGRHLERLDDALFARYGLGTAQVAALRAKLAGWPRRAWSW